MIPFNLEKAKQGVSVRTREGVNAKLLAHLDGGQPAPLIVEIMMKQRNKQGRYIDGSTTIENYYIDGRHNQVHESPLDLFMQY